MSILDLSDDHLIFDGLEDLELVQAGSGRLQVVRNCLSFPVTIRDAAATNGTYSVSDMKFNFPAAETLNFEPLVGDFVRDNNGVLWSVGQIEVLTLKTRRQLWGKKANLHPALATCLKVYKPLTKLDDTNAAFNDWRLVKTANGFLDEVASEYEVNDGRKRTKITHRAYFLQTFPIQSGFLIEDSKGRRFNVRRVTDKDKIGSAMVVDCELSRTPVSN